MVVGGDWWGWWAWAAGWSWGLVKVQDKMCCDGLCRGKLAHFLLYSPLTHLLFVLSLLLYLFITLSCPLTFPSLHPIPLLLFSWSPFPSPFLFIHPSLFTHLFTYPSTYLIPPSLSFLLPFNIYLLPNLILLRSPCAHLPSLYRLRSRL